MGVKESQIRKVIMDCIRRQKSPRALLRYFRSGYDSEICSTVYLDQLVTLRVKKRTGACKQNVPDVFRRKKPDPRVNLLLHILVNNGQGVITGKNNLNKWLIDKDQLQFIEIIDNGSSGIIYKGMYMGDKVAVKVLKGFRRGSRTEGEFRREVSGLISCSDHKNVLKLLGVCLDHRHRICIVTKFMEGGSLYRYLHTRQNLQLKEVLRLATDIAEGMRCLHSRGILHRDIKSANVLLDEEGNAVIGDLGICGLWNDEENAKQVGTYRWMAPEVLGDESGESMLVTPQSDVYSFGILLWELVTSKLPYADYTPVQAAMAVVINGLRPHIPEDCFPPLSFLIEKCWAQNPYDRPSSTQILNMLNIISKHRSGIHSAHSRRRALSFHDMETKPRSL